MSRHETHANETEGIGLGRLSDNRATVRRGRDCRPERASEGREEGRGGNHQPTVPPCELTPAWPKHHSRKTSRAQEREDEMRAERCGMERELWVYAVWLV